MTGLILTTSLNANQPINKTMLITTSFIAVILFGIYTFRELTSRNTIVSNLLSRIRLFLFRSF
jgi:hypothetical protein